MQASAFPFYDSFVSATVQSVYSSAFTMKLGFLGFTYNRSKTGMRFASENSKQEP